MAVCLGSEVDCTCSNPAAPLHIGFFFSSSSSLSLKNSKYFCRIYSVGKGRPAAGSIVTAIKLTWVASVTRTHYTSDHSSHNTTINMPEFVNNKLACCQFVNNKLAYLHVPLLP